MAATERTVFPVGRRGRPASGLLHVPRLVATALLLLCLSAGFGAVLVQRASIVHPLVAVCLGTGLVVLAITKPRSGIAAMLYLLPLLALARRLLIPFGGWHPTDPLIVIGPLVALVLINEARPLRLPRSPLASAIVALLAVTALESLNPDGGGLKPGVYGFVYTAAPVLWFFAGRKLADARLVASILRAVVVLAIPLGVYGLAQSRLGLPSWDAAWLQVTNYNSLHVGTALRGFATFSSSTEYAVYLGIAATIALAFLLHGQVLWVVALPFLAYAMVYEGIRGVAATTVAAIVAVVALRTRRPLPAIAVAAVGVAAVVLAFRSYAPGLAAQAQASGDPILQHQVNGFVHPLNPDQSSFLTHWRLFVDGLKAVPSSPLGAGSGATNLAGARFGGITSSTEIDVTNEFVNLGIVGGVLYAGIVLLTLKHALSLALRRGGPLFIAAAGMLIVTITQWLNPGFYAVAPLVWFTIGWIDRESAEPETAPARESTGPLEGRLSAPRS